MPRIAALLDVQQLSEITEVTIRRHVRSPDLCGQRMATVKSNDSVKAITVRATAFEAGRAEAGPPVSKMWRLQAIQASPASSAAS